MIYYIIGLFISILSIVMIFYFKATENVRIKILDILQVYGSILGLISVFLVTYDRFISKNIQFIKIHAIMKLLKRLSYDKAIHCFLKAFVGENMNNDTFLNSGMRLPCNSSCFI